MGVVYRRPSSLGGNDILLIVILTVAGIVIIVRGLGDRLWLDEIGRLVATAGATSVAAWVLGMGFRFGFAYHAYHSGATEVAEFSRDHQITGAHIWTTALVLVAFSQVRARVGVLQERRRAARSTRRAPAKSIAPEPTRESTYWS